MEPNNDKKWQNILFYIKNLEKERTKMQEDLTSKTSDYIPAFFDQDKQKKLFQETFEKESPISESKFQMKSFSFNGFLDDLIFFIKQDLVIFNEKLFKIQEHMIGKTFLLLDLISKLKKLEFPEDSGIIFTICSVLISCFVKKEMFKEDCKSFYEFFQPVIRGIHDLYYLNPDEILFASYKEGIQFMNPIKLQNQDRRNLFNDNEKESLAFFVENKKKLMKISTIIELNPSCFKSENLSEFLKRISWDYKLFKSLLISITILIWLTKIQLGVNIISLNIKITSLKILITS